MRRTELDFDIIHGNGNGGAIVAYQLHKGFEYYSKRYGKSVVVEDGFKSDGASGPATDIVSEAWWVHDKLCTTWKFADGSPCSRWQASSVLYDILKAEGRWFRARTWFWATWLFGPSPKKEKKS